MLSVGPCRVGTHDLSGRNSHGRSTAVPPRARMTAGSSLSPTTCAGPGTPCTRPTCYDGRTFDDLDEGLGFARETGFQEVFDRGVSAAEGLPSSWSMPASRWVRCRRSRWRRTDPVSWGSPVHSASRSRPTGVRLSWPDDVPVQVHAMDDDAFFVGDGDIVAARALVGRPTGELFLYPGDRHLFADPASASYDADAAALLARADAGVPRHPWLSQRPRSRDCRSAEGVDDLCAAAPRSSPPMPSTSRITGPGSSPVCRLGAHGVEEPPQRLLAEGVAMYSQAYQAMP